MSDDLHSGMNPDDLTQKQDPPAVPAPVRGRIAGNIFAAFKKLGVPDGDEPKAVLEQLSKDIAHAVVDEIKNYAKLTITVEAGPPPTATATIE